ncbi:MAG: efflux RND transporter periplasmic adaptor subunit [Dehalococcoidia bacterium]|nr:efflux RND transporter periplasmic adaptor subunit [Dehalococcoidia bacterium]
MSRPLKTVAIIVVIVAALGVGGYFVRAQIAGPSAAPAAAVNTVPVTRGAIKVAVNTSGSITVPNQSQAKLSFDVTGGVSGSVSGTVSKLNVDVGSLVKKGNTLAELSSDTLQTQLQQQQASLSSAQAKLDALRAGSRPEDIATAESAVRSAKIRLGALSTSARPEQIAAAKAQLNANKAKLDQLLRPTATDIAAAQSAIDTAQHNVDTAKTRLDQLLHPSAGDVAAAQASVASAANSVATARAQLNKLTNPSQADLSAANAAVQSAQATVNAKQAGLNNLINSLGHFPSYTETANAQNDAVSAQTSLAVAQLKLDQLRQPLKDDIDSANASTAAAQASYDTAKTKLDQLLHPNAGDISIAQASVGIAQAALDSAKAKLDILKNPNPADIAAAQATVASAEQTLAALNAPLNTDVQLQQEAIAQAQQALSLRQNPYTPNDIVQAQATVAQAQAQVNSTQKQMDGSKILAPFDGVVTAVNVQQGMGVSASAVVIQMSEVGKLQVVATVDEVDVAKVRTGQLASLTMEALPGIPVSARVGLISYLGTSTSGIVSYDVYLDILPQQPSAIGSQSGASASPSATPRAGATASGTPRAGTTASGTPRAGGTGRPAGSNGQPINVLDLLHPGFTVLASITVDQRDNILTVPVKAVRQSGQTRVVRVLVNGAVEDRTVTTGVTDSQNIEVTSGLQEGDMVVADSSAKGTAPQTTPTFGVGGGFGGGLRPPGR